MIDPGKQKHSSEWRWSSGWMIIDRDRQRRLNFSRR
jgi:hypothetical protein